MRAVVHLAKPLRQRPAVVERATLMLRHFHDPSDVPAWLDLRTRAFAEQRPPIGAWSTDDFHREMSNKPWWRRDRTWVIQQPDDPTHLIGSVTMALSARGGGTAAAVHWLMVDPDWRRRGLGELLISKLEQAAWDDGFRETQVETHTGWMAAMALYEKLGYQRGS